MTRCRALRQADQWRCILCRLTWDVDDPEPPACPEKEKDTK